MEVKFTEDNEFAAAVMSRLRSPLAGGTLFFFFVFNWDAIAYLFGSELPIDQTIMMVKAHYLTFSKSVVMPFTSSLVYLLLYPWLSGQLDLYRDWVEYLLDRAGNRIKVKKAEQVIIASGISAKASQSESVAEIQKQVDAVQSEWDLLSDRLKTISSSIDDKKEKLLSQTSREDKLVKALEAIDAADSASEADGVRLVALAAILKDYANEKQMNELTNFIKPAVSSEVGPMRQLFSLGRLYRFCITHNHPSLTFVIEGMADILSSSINTEKLILFRTRLNENMKILKGGILSNKQLEILEGFEALRKDDLLLALGVLDEFLGTIGSDSSSEALEASIDLRMALESVFSQPDP